MKRHPISLALFATLLFGLLLGGRAEGQPLHDQQIDRLLSMLKSGDIAERSSAIENLGFIRAYRAAPALIGACSDSSAEVRREACLSLSWCGGRACLPALLGSLDDPDWSVRQAAWVALTNLTGMEFPFEGHESNSVRAEQIAVWKRWVETRSFSVMPSEWKDLLALPPEDLARGCAVEASSTYKGPSLLHRRERALRALGCLGGEGAEEQLIQALKPYVSRGSSVREEKWMVQAGIRALGRQAKKAAGEEMLAQLMNHPQWARYAADALGDVGTAAALNALLDAYPDYAVPANKQGAPAKIPADDKPGFEAVDRMYETPSVIAAALTRFPFDSPDEQRRLRELAPLFVANMAGDFDGAMLYEEQAFQPVTRWLLERAGLRREVCAEAFDVLGLSDVLQGELQLSAEVRQTLRVLAGTGPGGTSFAASWLTALCRDADAVPALITLLEHPNGWVRINAAKTLMFMGEASSAKPIARLLDASRTEAEYGTFGGFLFKDGKHQGQDEMQAPSPNWREAFTRALGPLGGKEHVPLLIRLLNDERNVLEVRYAAATSLGAIGGAEAEAALVAAASKHVFHSIRLLAREYLWRQGISWEPAASPRIQPAVRQAVLPDAEFDALVFIKGDNRMPNDFQIDIWRQTYSTTDSGPTYRLGRNLYKLKPPAPNGVVTPLTEFTDGYVADCEVSWDGQRVVFARRGGEDPWWHIYELEVSSGTLTQLTRGPYHDVQPAYLPDGRIVFSSSRIGMRDEYHGYPATGLTVMQRDGTGMDCIGFNLGRDNEPSIMPDGRIVFSRLDLFYSRLKTEISVYSMHPDGTRVQTLYGPERRALWRQVTRSSGERWPWGEAPPRHRVLRLTQPQAIDAHRVIVATTGGATIVGPGASLEQILPRHQNMAVTSPFPLDDERVLCAATTRSHNRQEVDLGLYLMNIDTGALTLLYNDPATADFEARPLRSRAKPPTLPASVKTTQFTARLMCLSALTSREEATRRRGKLVRIVEGQPVVGRHHTHTSTEGEAWKNHTGTKARVLGTVPLASDGSFFVEIPADRLVHCQVLDSDRRVVGNQLLWMTARPGETRSCIGCHEMPDSAAITRRPELPVSARFDPIRCLPTGGEFSYRAKVWQKGSLDDEAEERTRTVNAIGIPGRP